MADSGSKMDKLSVLRPKLRIGLLALQVLLPLAGYAALQAGQRGVAVGVAAAFSLSMVVLIWLG